MKGRHVISLTFIIIIISIGLRKNCATSTDYNLIFCIDDHIAAQEKQTIINFISNAHKNNNAQLPNTITSIQQQFPFIESIQTILLPNRMMQYTIHATKPYCIVNQDHLFTNSNQLTTKHIFTAKSISTLPSLQVNEPTSQKKQDLLSLQQCIATLPNTLFAHYQVTWFNPMHIQLQDKQHPQFSILCSIDRIPNDHLLTACNTIKQDLLKKSLLPNPELNVLLKKNTKKNQSNSSNWAADIRFNNHIVLYAEKRGS